MTGTHATAGRGNPFTTRHTRPGRLVPRDADGAPLDLDALVARARALRAVAIVGPHGAGKTNLLTALAGRLAAAGHLAGLVRARSRPDAALVLRAVREAPPDSTLCIDGWEAVGAVRGMLIRRWARCRRVGLIVTSHRPTGMPVVVRCATTAALLARLVAELPGHGGVIAKVDVEQAFRAHRGDIREALYDLYDRFERRIRTA